MSWVRERMRRKADQGPRSELARYAFGYSDRKPSRSFWLIFAGMVLFVLLQLLVIS